MTDGIEENDFPGTREFRAAIPGTSTDYRRHIPACMAMHFPFKEWLPEWVEDQLRRRTGGIAWKVDKDTGEATSVAIPASIQNELTRKVGALNQAMQQENGLKVQMNTHDSGLQQQAGEPMVQLRLDRSALENFCMAKTSVQAGFRSDELGKLVRSRQQGSTFSHGRQQS